MTVRILSRSYPDLSLAAVAGSTQPRMDGTVSSLKSRGSIMSVEREKDIEWDGTILRGWVTVDGKPVKVSADRKTIHEHAPGWNDALTWEIERHRDEIFEKLAPFFSEQLKTI